MILYIIPLFLPYLFAYPCSEITFQKSFTFEEVEECINETSINQLEIEGIINDLKEAAQAYVLTDINNSSIKEHPIDLIQQINEIKTENQTLFSFFQSIFFTFQTTFDPSLTLRVPESSSFNDLLGIYDILFNYNINGIYITPNTNCELFGIKPSIIEKSYLTSINDIDPIKFLLSFAKKYGSYISQHAQLSWVLSSISNIRLSKLPLSFDDLKTPLKLTTNNGTIYTLYYQFVKIEPNSFNELSVSSFKRNECYVMNERRTNVLILSSFETNDINNLNDCLKKFDSNSYPIGIVLQQPKVFGNNEVAASLHQSIVLHDDTRLIGSFRYFDTMNLFYKKEFINQFKDFECKQINIEDIGSQLDSFNNMTHQRTESILYVFNSLTKTMSSLRKSNDIVIFSDGLCTGVCSHFALGLVLRGSSISVTYGYEGNDNKVRISQGSTLSMQETDSRELNNLKRNNLKLNLPVFEIYDYHYNSSESFPLELSNIIPDFHLNRGQFSSVNDIITETLRIIDKFQIQCNELNDRMKYDSIECNIYESTSHKYGGFKCINNSWSNKCEPSYCDYNYFLDSITLNCIKNSCVNIDENDEDTNISILVYVGVSFIILISMLIVSILLGIFILFMHRQNQKLNYNHF
ncbi:hypothetical protein EDI_085410 [Entamoeba dispar SAW760]|uniref:Uncharacterized protein n=1 Tax=Entamoeba dispar (strain ATCC PRA-260 / SAW760) TaxID=370354 RepID=B0EF01_ENTDS|nr:uncharacterized protein EDI_085410 [Entamoeba dispar SAW760]EDR26850.1 hypothetical protein EDI_085410 [Entamoeba dispar SAW760]|eukprot:EDR26850.1 hypothetical protein EDI_085410 [Entamoeba dispar SAW760]